MMGTIDGPAEALLLEAARGGDRRALDELLGGHRDRLRAVCVRITGNAADAEDAVQDCLVSVWNGLARFRGDSAFSTWTHRVAANAALAVVRRRRETADELPDLPDARSRFDDDLAERDRVRHALRDVPEPFRAALVLREYGGLSYAEIAAHQRIPVQTVKSRLNRARSAVRAALAEGG